jgi:CRP-like cAMP-binding protein
VRAQRLLGSRAWASDVYRTVVGEMTGRGETLKAIALASELARMAPRLRGLLDDIAQQIAPGRGSGDADRAHNLLDDTRMIEALTPSKVTRLEQLNRRSESPDLPFATESRPDLGAPAWRPETPPAAISLDRVPLFGVLGKKAFVELATQARVRSIGVGEVLFREGEPATSLAIVIDGELVTLRKLRDREAVTTRSGPAEVVGLFGLFSSGERTATVRASRDALILEIPAAALEKLIQRHPSAGPALRRFYQERLLLGFLGQLPMVGELDPSQLRELVSRTRERRFGKRQTVLGPGETGNVIHLICEGGVSVVRRVNDRTQEVARLERGQVLGSLSGITGEPLTVAAMARSETLVATLGQRTLGELIRAHPALRRLPERMERRGLMVAPDVFASPAGLDA